VPKDGYIYVAIFSFTNKELAQALIDAKERGVDVRIISDRENSESRGEDEARQNKLLQNLVAHKIPVKVNFYGPTGRKNIPCMHLKVSIVNGLYVVTGSYNYTYPAQEGNEENLVVIPARTNRQAVERYRHIFLSMWFDWKNYRDFPLRD